MKTMPKTKLPAGVFIHEEGWLDGKELW